MTAPAPAAATEEQAAALTLAALAEILNPVDPRVEPDTSNPPPLPLNRRLMPLLSSSFVMTGEPMPLPDARIAILQTLHDYANRSRGFRLLVGAPAGTGKSHQAIAFVQERAAMGERWLWAAQNHAMWEDLSRQPNFDPELWYHWQPMDGEINGEEACRFANAQRRWTEKGYKAWNLCRQLCGRKHDRNDENELTYMDSCPFRTQGQNNRPIVFCMHQHLFTGIDAGHFDGVIIDESFISLIAREKYVNGNELKQGNINMKVVDLANKLIEIWSEIRAGLRPYHVAGKQLLNELGPIYPDAVAQLQIMEEAEELKAASKNYRNPFVTDSTQVESLQTIYMDELTVALYPEYMAWQAGVQLWAERVWLDRDGLHYVTPAQSWKEMPKKMIVLDATGRAGFYQYALGGAVEEYRPFIERMGRIIQVTGRNNGKGVVVDKTPTKDTKGGRKWDMGISKATVDFINTVRRLVRLHDYQNIAVICANDAEKFIKAELSLSDDQIMHFYKLRGRNDLQNCDAVFVYGTPTPSERTVTNIMLALDPKRIEPIFKLDEEGKHIPLSAPAEREFRLSPDGLRRFQEDRGAQYFGAARLVRSYKDHMAAAIQSQMREAELLQAVYRARLLTNAADVYVFSGVPLDEPIDALYDDPPIAPPGINWKLWIKILEWCENRRSGGNDVFGYAELAEGIGVTEDHLRHIGVMRALDDYYGAEIESIRLPEANVKKGRKKELRKWTVV